MALGITYARELGSFTGLGVTRQSIGITPIVVAQRFKARGLEPFRLLSVSPDKVTNNGYDYSWGGGLRVGWLGSLLHDRLNVGISYQTKLWMSDFNDYQGLFAKGGDFDIPPVFNVGLALLITPKLSLLTDFKRIFYHDIDALADSNDVALAALVRDPEKRLGGDDGLGFGWDDVNVYSVGLQYEANDKLTLRGGFSIGDQPWKNVNTLFNVLAPATIEKHASLGATYRVDKQSRVSFSYTHAFENTIEGTSTFTGPQTGYVRMYQNMVQISYSRDIGL